MMKRIFALVILKAIGAKINTVILYKFEEPICIQGVSKVTVNFYFLRKYLTKDTQLCYFLENLGFFQVL